MFDVIKEISYFCDYKTTKNLISIYPQLNNIWRKKCDANEYLEFYSGEENYLIQKKKEFAISITNDFHVGGFLFQYDKMLEEVISLGWYNYDDYCELVKINVRKRYLLLNKFKIIGQYDSKDEIDINKKRKHEIYIIVDMESVVPYFLKYGSLRGEIDPCADYEIFQ